MVLGIDRGLGPMLISRGSLCQLAKVTSYRPFNNFELVEVLPAVTHPPLEGLALFKAPPCKYFGATPALVFNIDHSKQPTKSASALRAEAFQNVRHIP